MAFTLHPSRGQHTYPELWSPTKVGKSRGVDVGQVVLHVNSKPWTTNDRRRNVRRRQTSRHLCSLNVSPCLSLCLSLGQLSTGKMHSSWRCSWRWNYFSQFYTKNNELLDPLTNPPHIQRLEPREESFKDQRTWTPIVRVGKERFPRDCRSLSLDGRGHHVVPVQSMLSPEQ